MAITFSVKPYGNNTFNSTALDQVISGLSSNHKAVETSVNISGVTHYSTSLIKVTTASSHGLIVGDVVTISGTTDYNGVFQLFYVVASTYFYVAASYTSSQTGSVIRTNENFKFKFELINSSDSIILTKYLPCFYNSSNVAQYKVNISSILRDVIDENEPPDIDAVAYSYPPGGGLAFYYRITELHDDEDGLVISRDSAIDDNSGDYYQAVEMYPDGISTATCQPHICTNRGYDDYFLTNRPSPRIHINEPFFIAALIGSDYDEVKLSVSRNDKGGPTDGITVVNIPATGWISVSANRKISFPINSTTTGVNTNTQTLTLTVKGRDGVISDTISQDYVIYITDQKCNDVYLVFKNFHGEYDTVKFSNTVSKVMDIERETYLEHNTNPFYTKGVKKTYHTKGFETITLSSGYLTDEEMYWLKQLVLSGEIYLVDTDEYYKPVTILNKEFVIDEYRNLNKLVLDVEVMEQNHI